MLDCHRHPPPPPHFLERLLNERGLETVIHHTHCSMSLLMFLFCSTISGSQISIIFITLKMIKP